MNHYKPRWTELASQSEPARLGSFEAREPLRAEPKRARASSRASTYFSSPNEKLGTAKQIVSVASRSCTERDKEMLDWRDT